jgi:hypothetical protein
MALATLSVAPGSVAPLGPIQSNDQRTQTFYGRLQVSGFSDTYPVGGMALDSVLQAALLPNTNQAPIRVILYSETGSGYIYQRIPSTGKLMVLQVPVNGSLTTAAPLNQLPSSLNSLSGVFNDVIGFEATYLRNA